MSTRRLGRVDDTHRRYTRDPLGAPPPRRSRETIPSSAIPTREVSEVSAGRTTSPTSQLRNENVHSRSDARLPHDIQESARVERDRMEARKRGATPPKKEGQASMYSKEAEGTASREEVRQSKEEDRHRYNGDRTSDTLRVKGYPSLKGNVETLRPEPGVSPTPSLQHLLEAKSREANRFQHELKSSLEDYRVLMGSYTSLQQVSEEREKKLNALRHERQAAVAQKEEVQNAHAALKQQFDELSNKFNIVRRDCGAALEQKKRAQEECLDLAQRYGTQMNEHLALNNKCQSLKATLEQRTSELQGVQKFISTADKFSGSEVVNTLRRLNEEVNQNSAFMAEWSVGNFTFMPSATQIVEQTRTSEILGTRFLELLGARRNQDNPILVEMTFRAYLIYELYFVASPWSLGQEEQSHNQYIDEIYQRMREAEGQAVSGNWRALTRAYTLPACISDPEVARSLVTNIVSGFSDILLAAGCTSPKEDIIAAFWSKFTEKIHHFVSLAGQVSKIIGVGVISEDFEVQVVWPGSLFEEKTMEDVDDNGDRVHGAEEHQETVLYAAELGLMQRMRMGGTATDKTKPTELIVVKPKVVLASVLDALAE